MKDATVRINSVLGFIQNSNLLTANEVQSAYQLANNFINARYPPGNAGQQAYNNFSNGMSLGFHIASDPNNLRQMKRASYLLDRAILDAVPAAAGYVGLLNVGQIADGSAQVTFENYLRKAAITRETATGATNAAQQAYLALLNQPLAFLQTNKLIVLGYAVRAVGMGDQNIQTFHFGYDPVHNRFKFDKGANPGFYAVQVDSVVAQWWTSVPNSWVGGNPNGGNFSQITAIELASPMMVTTQFTGCAFCMKMHGAHTYCAHLTPKRDKDDANAMHAVNGAPVIDGTELARRVRQNNGVNGDFANAAGGNQLSIYGAGFSHNVLAPAYPFGLGGGTNYMTIIGVLRAPGYEIFSQITQNDAITSAQQIF